MKALDNVKTDDLNAEQKKLLADLIKKEMIEKIEAAVDKGEVNFAEHIKNYLRASEDDTK